MQMDSGPPPYSSGHGQGHHGQGGRRFSASRLGLGMGMGYSSSMSASEETLLLPGKQRSLSTANMPPHHYYQSLPEVTVLLAETEAEPLDERAEHAAHRPWKDMGSSLGGRGGGARGRGRTESLTARLGLEKTNWWGIFLALVSGMFFTMSSAAVKALRSVDPMELLVIRSLVQVVVVLPVALYSGVGVLGPKGHRGLLQLQGVVGALTLVLLFFSFRRLPLGDATTIIFSSPVFVLILSFLFLREPCGFFRTLVVCMLLTGVVLISKPPFLFQAPTLGLLHNAAAGLRTAVAATTVATATAGHSYDVVGYACALLATLFTAANIVIMRKCKDVHFSVVVLQLSLWSLLTSGSLLAYLGPRQGDIRLPHGLWQWALVGMVAAFGLSGQLLVAHALSLEGAGKVAVTRSLDIVLAFAIQVLGFGEVPDWMSVTGALLVLVCVLGMGMESQLHRAAARVP
ncbi:solute carrier family 35 member G1-like [Thrips palmi]|uniref:Solute carrier family 35 member G1-like n=1 Tax=Thrips palmi TaxID=161013 RepID=A0A6P8ZY78_THRPL|nr:solute carrier family 35 member G1-like [Thrips palmi]